MANQVAFIVLLAMDPNSQDLAGVADDMRDDLLDTFPVISVHVWDRQATQLTTAIDATQQPLQPPPNPLAP